MSRAPDRRLRRLHGLALAALLVASQTAAWVHASVVSHVTCLEHGESIHAGADALDAPPAPASPDEVRIGADEPATAAGHEHCASGAILRWRDLALTAPVATATLPSFSPLPPVERARASSAGAALYLVAPKTSPPAPRA